MSTITIDESRLEEIVDQSVRKHLKTNLDDVEEVRRSPAGVIVRIETRLETIEKNIEKTLATKTDLANLKTEISDSIGKQSERIAKVETSLKLIFAMLLSMLALLIKLVFFS